MLYALYFDENNSLNLKDCLEIVLKKYNNHIHSATKMTPNEIFYSRSEDLYATVLNNIKKSFKNVGKDFYNFSENEKILLKSKFIIKKKFINDKPGNLIFNKIKNKKIYKKINATVIKKSGFNYLVTIEKDYLIYGLYKNDRYYVNYKLLKKCDKDAWIKLLRGENNRIDFNGLIDNNDVLSDNEENFIIDNNKEFH